MQALYPLKIQAIRSKGQQARLYVYFPLPLAAAIGLHAGEEVQWELLDRGELHLVRKQVPPILMRSEFKELLVLTKQSVQIAEDQRQSLADLATTRKAFEAAVGLFENFCKITLFAVSNPHRANPQPPAGREELFAEGNDLFDSLCALELHLKNISSSVASIEFNPQQAPTKDLSTSQLGHLSEEDLFCGTVIKLTLAGLAGSDVETNHYCDTVEQLLSRYKAEFVDNIAAGDKDLLSPDEYPEGMAIRDRRFFGHSRCHSYYLYLKGKLLEHRRQYRDALELYQLSQQEDPSRNNSDWASMTFYRPDYATIGVLEALLRNSLSSTPPSTPPNEWPGGWAGDVARLNNSKNALTDLFLTHPAIQSEPGLFYAGLSAIEWTTFTADGALDDWKNVDKYCDLLCTQVPHMKTTGIPIPPEMKKVFATHRSSLKTISSGYSTDYTAEATNVKYESDPNYEYTKLQLAAIHLLCSSYKLSVAKDPAWDKGLDGLRKDLSNLPDSKKGLPFPILLRLRADVDEIILKRGFYFSARFEKFKTQFDADKTEDERDSRCNQLAASDSGS